MHTSFCSINNWQHHKILLLAQERTRSGGDWLRKEPWVTWSACPVVSEHGQAKRMPHSPHCWCCPKFSLSPLDSLSLGLPRTQRLSLCSLSWGVGWGTLNWLEKLLNCPIPRVQREPHICQQVYQAQPRPWYVMNSFAQDTPHSKAGPLTKAWSFGAQKLLRSTWLGLEMGRCEFKSGFLPHRHLYMNVHGSTFYNSQKVGMPAKWCIDKQNTVHPYSGISLGTKGMLTSYHMYKPWQHYAKWNKPVTKDYILDDFIHVKAQSGQIYRDRKKMRGCLELEEKGLGNDYKWAQGFFWGDGECSKIMAMVAQLCKYILKTIELVYKIHLSEAVLFCFNGGAYGFFPGE